MVPWGVFLMKKGGPKNDLKKERSKMGSRGSCRSVGSKILGRNNPRKKGRGKRNEERGMRNKIWYPEHALG